MLDYFSLIYKKHGITAFYEKPKLTVSTIHGVKGGEVDNVIMLLEMSNRTHQSYMQDKDPERCVWFVGATRAKEKLIVVVPPPGEPQFYEAHRCL